MKNKNFDRLKQFLMPSKKFILQNGRLLLSFNLYWNSWQWWKLNYPNRSNSEGWIIQILPNDRRNTKKLSKCCQGSTIAFKTD